MQRESLAALSGIVIVLSAGMPRACRSYSVPMAAAAAAPHYHSISGVVYYVGPGAGVLELKDSTGRILRFSLTPRTVIRRAGKLIGIDAIRAGDRISDLRYDARTLEAYEIDMDALA